MLDKRKSLATAKRRAEAVELYLAGWTQTAIAEKQGVTQPAIFEDIQVTLRELHEQRIADMELKQQEQVAKHQKVGREAWEAWERSQKDAETSKQSTGTNEEGGDWHKSEKTKRGQYGDPRFLDIVIKANEAIAKLMGLNAPDKLEITDRGGMLVREVIVRDRSELAALPGIVRASDLAKPNGNGKTNGNGKG
jgi:hypothetical protein